MNIWKVNFDVDKYMWCILCEKGNIRLLDFLNFFDHEEELPTDLTCRNKDKQIFPTADVMQCSGTASGIVNEKFKIASENKYSGLFKFYPIKLIDNPNEKYYILVPNTYLDMNEILDMNSTIFRYRDEKRVMSEILKYSFNSKVIGHHFFRMCYNERKFSITKYCDDEFKEFIEKNNITGLKFIKVFEFNCSEI